MSLRRMVRKLHGHSAADGRETRIIVGLGNPGARYANTRHNLGFMVGDELCRRLPAGKRSERFQAVLDELIHNDTRVIVARPLTYMNNSGQAVSQLVRWYKTSLENLLIVYDELDLPFGRIRLRPGGSAGGHNGMASIVKSLGSDEFARLRIGIGRPVSGSTVDYVLSRFNTHERDELPELITLSADAALAWLTVGLEPAMNEYNRRTLRRLQPAERGQPAAAHDSSR